MSEQLTQPNDSDIAEVQTTPEKIEVEANRQEILDASEPASNLQEAQKKREFQKKNNDLVLDWLINQVGITTDNDFYIKFKKVLEENHEQDSEGLDQATELLSKIPELFEQVDEKIAELGKDTAKYGKIHEKRIEIIKGICEPILNGHLTGEDGAALVAGIEIISINDPDPEKQKLFKDMNIKSGYEGVMFCDIKTHKIYIFNETLVDEYPGFKDGLKIKHMITHEMSHNIVECSVKYNKTLVAKANEIIEKAGEIKDSQSMHIRNTLNGIVNAESDFGKYFADHLAKSDTYNAMPDEQKKQFEEAEKKKFISDRKIQAAAEILTDYTAMYLQSDGSIEDFVLTCLKISDPKAIKKFFGEDLNLTEEKLSRLNEITDPKTKKALFARIGEKYSDLAEIYTTFYKEIHEQLISSKGSFSELTARDMGDEEDPFAEYFGPGYMDGPAGFGQQESGDGNRNASRGGESLLSEFGALIKAMSEEAPNVK